jgi:hypothetical protein
MPLGAGGGCLRLPAADGKIGMVKLVLRMTLIMCLMTITLKVGGTAERGDMRCQRWARGEWVVPWL